MILQHCPYQEIMLPGCVPCAHVAVLLQSMAWLGQQLVLCTSLRYILLHPLQQTTTQLFALAAEAPSPTLVQSIPAANLALLLMVCS